MFAFCLKKLNWSNYFKSKLRKCVVYNVLMKTLDIQIASFFLPELLTIWKTKQGERWGKNIISTVNRGQVRGEHSYTISSGFFSLGGSPPMREKQSWAVPVQWLLLKSLLREAMSLLCGWREVQILLIEASFLVETRKKEKVVKPLTLRFLGLFC